MSNQPEHPMAARLFREYRAGSKIMTKIEAYAIGNEMNALLARVVELQQENDELRKAGGSLVRQVMAAKESLTAL